MEQPQPQLQESSSSSSQERTLFLEQEQCQTLLSLLLQDNDDGVNSNQNHTTIRQNQHEIVSTLRTIFDKYLEAPTLLDPHLEGLMRPLGNYCQTAILLLNKNKNDDDDDDALLLSPNTTTLLYACSVVYAITKVCGRKKIKKYFPHEIVLIEPLLSHLVWLNNQQQQLQSQQLQSQQQLLQPPIWESIYISWIWLELLSLTPFSRHVVFARDETLPLLVNLAQQHLSSAGPMRETAATALASWLIRSDCEEWVVTNFVPWCHEQLLLQLLTLTTTTTTNSSSSSHPTTIFLSLGILQTLCTMLKVGHRDSSSMTTNNTNTNTANTKNHHQLVLWDTMRKICDECSNNNNNNIQLRKWMTKWMTRMGCAQLLAPKNTSASWRYQRGGRRTLNLLQNLQQAAAAASSSTSTSAERTNPVVENDATDNKDNNDNNNDTDDDNDDDDYLFQHHPIPDTVEDVMHHLLTSLSDSSTIVRWSAAKGIGRITERLPSKLCVEDVLDYMLERLRRNADNNASLWQGSCLALGELARRGLILPQQLELILEPLIVPAIRFDTNNNTSTSTSTSSASVRDAACYTYWALARAYAPSVLKHYVQRMSQALVVTSVLDREVNCRRAASAAFQESVGRQGAQNFPHGIEIITTADYYSLGNRTDSFLTIAPYIASQFPDTYRRPLMDHLRHRSLVHWDMDVRILASQSLGKMSRDMLLFNTTTHATHTTTNDDDSSYMTETVIPTLLEQSTNSELVVRHGAVLGLAELMPVIPTLYTTVDGSSSSTTTTTTSKTTTTTANDAIDTSTIIDIHVFPNLVAKLERLRLYRGRGGEVMRSAVCRYIECLTAQTRTKFPLTVRQQVRLLDSCDEHLRHSNEDIQDAAASALSVLMRNYFPVSTVSGGQQSQPSARLQARVVDKYVRLVQTSEYPAETRGYSMALGVLPKKLLMCSLDTVLTDCLIPAARPTAPTLGGHLHGTMKDAETRRNALRALTSIAMEVGFVTHHHHHDKEEEEESTTTTTTTPSTTTTSPQLVSSHSQYYFLHPIIQALLLSLEEDYNTDRRGDVGSWCRMEAMKGLEQLVVRICMANTTTTILDTNDNDNHQQQHQQEEEKVWIRIWGGFLKQLSEKLDQVRLLAGQVLERLLRSTTTTTSTLLPFADELRTALQITTTTTTTTTVTNTNTNDNKQHHPTTTTTTNTTTNWSDAKRTYRLVLQAATTIPQLFDHVISGMVISVGALTKAVQNEAEDALVDWMIRIQNNNDTNNQGRRGGGLERLGQTFLNLFRNYRGKRRVILPLLKTIDILLNKKKTNRGLSLLDPLLLLQLPPPVLNNNNTNDATTTTTTHRQTTTSSYSSQLLDLIQMEIQRSSSGHDVHRLFAATNVVLGLLRSTTTAADDDDDAQQQQQQQYVNTKIYEFLLHYLLHHEYPRVRKHTADHLYVRLLELEEDDNNVLLPLSDNNNKDQIYHLLLQGQWELEYINHGDLCYELAKLLHVPASFRIRDDETTTKIQQQQQQKKKPNNNNNDDDDDDFNSYACLVKESL